MNIRLGLLVIAFSLLVVIAFIGQERRINNLDERIDRLIQHIYETPPRRL